jgi:hypothetical protein
MKKARSMKHERSSRFSGDDVFVQTSVRKRQLAAELTLKNLGSRAERVRVVSRVEGTDVTLCDEEVTVPAGASTTA